MKLKKKWKKYFDSLFTLGLVLMAVVGFGRHYDFLPKDLDRVLSFIAIVLVLVMGTTKNIKKLWED